MAIRRSAPLLLAVALASCTVGPDYARPENDSPATWRRTPPLNTAAIADASNAQ